MRPGGSKTLKTSTDSLQADRAPSRMSHISPASSDKGRLRSYVTGFVLSVVLTLTAFLIVSDKLLAGWGLLTALLGFAVIQLMVQLLFFLHLDREKKPWWNWMAFAFMAVVLLILVGGTLWIMNNLSYRTMSPSETDNYLLEEEAIEP